jgi:acetyl-CoA carboxylase carboxyltransferase component
MTSFVKLIGRPAAFARHVSTTAFEKNMKIFEKFKAMMSEAELSMQNESSNPQKLNTWDRLKLLRDKDSFQLIISPLAGYFSPYGKVVNAGMVIAITKVGGRVAMVTLNDWMHKGGTVFPITLKKQLRAQEISRKNHIPSIYVVDSGGAFLPLQAEIFPDRNHGGRTFRNQAVMSSEGIPQISVVCGPCTAGGAYIPTMSEEAAMVRNTGSLYLAGPPLVKAATGEVISAEDLGGAYVHCSVSGCVDHFATSEEEAIQRIRQVMTSIDIRQTDNAFSSLPEEDSIEEFAKILPDPEDNYYRDFPMMEVCS